MRDESMRLHLTADKMGVKNFYKPPWTVFLSAKVDEIALSIIIKQ